MRVLLLMGSTGGGHRAAAEAVAAHLEQQPGVTATVRDALEDLGGAWGRLTSLYGPLVRGAPWLYGAVYRAFDGPLWALTQRASFVTLRHRVLAYGEQQRPDVVVSTHPLINHALVQARAMWRDHAGVSIPLCTVITDPVTFHPSWIAPGVDLFITATEAARARAMELGAPAEAVETLGFPIHPRFSLDGPAWTHGAAAGTPVVLLAGGGEGLRRFPELASAVLGLPSRPHVLAVTGRDTRSMAALERMAGARNDGRLQVFGFTTEMPALIRAADVVVQKAGPGLLHESMALGKPVVVVDAIPGQEEGNLRMVEEHHLGRVALGGAERAAAAVQDLLEDDAARARASAAGRAQSSTRHAANIAMRILRLGG